MNQLMCVLNPLMIILTVGLIVVAIKLEIKNNKRQEEGQKLEDDMIDYYLKQFKGE